MAVFFRVGTIAIAVFKVDAEILDRFSLQFFLHARVDGMRQPRSPMLFARRVGIARQLRFQVLGVAEHVGQLLDIGQAERLSEDDEIGCILGHRAFGDSAESRRRIGFEQMSAAIDRVHRLAATRLARVLVHEPGV